MEHAQHTYARALIAFPHVDCVFLRYGFWEIKLHHAQAAGGTRVGTSGHTAIMDTGTTLVVGPDGPVRSLALGVGAQCWFYHETMTTESLVLRSCNAVRGRRKGDRENAQRRFSARTLTHTRTHARALLALDVSCPSLHMDTAMLAATTPCS